MLKNSGILSYDKISVWFGSCFPFLSINHCHFFSFWEQISLALLQFFNQRHQLQQTYSNKGEKLKLVLKYQSQFFIWGRKRYLVWWWFQSGFPLRRSSASTLRSMVLSNLRGDQWCQVWTKFWNKNMVFIGSLTSAVFSERWSGGLTLNQTSTCEVAGTCN